MLTNAALVIALLLVLLQVAQFGSEWRVVRFSLLAVSIVCFAARLGVSQFHEAKSADVVQTHTLAMDSTEDGMAILDGNGAHVYANSAFSPIVCFPRAQAVLL